MDTSIILLINGFLALLGVVLGHLFTKHTYMFQRNYEQKSDLIIDLYKKVIRLEFALKKYVHFTGAETSQDSIQRKINELSSIKKDFQKFQHKFWEVEIILEDSTIEKINEFLKIYISITSKLSVSNISRQLQDYKNQNSNWDESFNEVQNNLTEIKDDLKKEFRYALNR